MISPVNLVLFEPGEIQQPLGRGDRRAEHILRVLKRGVGEWFDAGIVNGCRGKATVTGITAQALEFSFSATSEPPPLPPVTLIVGMPRPQTARDILRDATTLGVAAIHFVTTERSDRNYAQSTLWSSGEWRRHVIAGAEQAFDTRIPEVHFGTTLQETLGRASPEIARRSGDGESPPPTETPSSHELPHGKAREGRAGYGRAQIALDNYEAGGALTDVRMAADTNIVLAIGPERGWSAGDREWLRETGFTLAHLGKRVLRTETAVVAGLAVIAATRR